MKKQKYKPFGQFANPFSIGLQLLDDGRFLPPDNKFAEYIAQKKSLFENQLKQVFMAEQETIEAQNEALNLVVNIVHSTHQNNPATSSDLTITCPVLGTKFTKSDYRQNPLVLASLLVQEDLVLMRRKPTGWHLVAASLCFPSSWNLAEKFGKILSDIHHPVPGANDRLDPMIHRIFDNLKPQLPVWRENWSIYADRELRHSTGEAQRNNAGEHGKSHKETFLRREYQTLHRLPESKDILFSIRILVEPLSILESQENPGEIAKTLLQQINAMDNPQLQYKGFNRDMSYTRTYLQSLASSKVLD